MTQIPAGWYPDPDPQAPEPKGQRYWDGRQWTEHVQPPVGQPQMGQAPLGQAPQGQPGYGSAPAYAPMSPYADAGRPAVATTPDGQELAGWWLRVAAYLIDAVIVGVISAVIAFPWMRDVFDAYGDFISQALDAAESGGAAPDQSELMAEITGPLAVVSLIGLVVSLVYHAGFLRWKAATPGKLALGMRVRLRETPGQMSWGTILKRWGSQFWYAIVATVPVIGGIAGLWPLVDGLWPLWDSKKQALHDKVAATNVVRQRGSV
ncbi:MAG TPA: RDD family protein [Nocardioides sp.]|uniref:RDD family protein n=1 Tax=Nocardioides sp. TaxID=35761 RepID=UPI002D7E19B0|nr:RDD family protein [Nocardioides sp.]HET6654458.1 RDD family protein [Nocardioides sp.]